MTRVLASAWPSRWVPLTALLAAAYVFTGLTSPVTAIRWPLLAGGALVLVSLWLAATYQLLARAVLAAGALLPAVTVWWSLVVPVTALMILICGSLAVRATSPAHPQVSGAESTTRT
jgi:hypothetical protein